MDNPKKVVKGVWRYERGNKICISKKYRQHNGQKKKDKQHTHKTAKWVTRTPLKTGVKSRAPEG